MRMRIRHISHTQHPGVEGIQIVTRLETHHAGIAVLQRQFQPGLGVLRQHDHHAAARDVADQGHWDHPQTGTRHFKLQGGTDDQVEGRFLIHS